MAALISKKEGKGWAAVFSFTVTYNMEWESMQDTEGIGRQLPPRPLPSLPTSSERSWKVQQGGTLGTDEDKGGIR
jgi:hypothetical protein